MEKPILQTTIELTDIDKAIDRLIAFEDGKSFQRIAISLAKSKWCDIIAMEYHKDGGEDAVAYPYLTKNKQRFDVACSITADYGKIMGDMKRIISRGIKLDFLIFYTPQKVSNDPTVQKWQTQFDTDFACGLIVVSREDIIQELIRPENNWICRQFLVGLDIKDSPNIDNIVAKSLIATTKIAEQWKRQIRSDTNQLIKIEASSTDDKEKVSGQNYAPSDIAQQLTGYRRIVLKGSPGTGKTTTLFQIAELLIKNYNKVPLLISLSEWAESKEDVLTFISKHPVLVATGISSSDIALLHEHSRLVFLFNGWNEIAPTLLDRVGRQLLQIDREFQAAGIIVTSREHSVSPSFFDPLNLILHPLTDRQRRTYIETVVTKEPEDLIYKIETSKTLNSITRTPLFLIETVQLYNDSADIPDSKYGILQSVVSNVETNPEHSASFQIAPLSGRAAKYLSALAFAMTKNGQVGIQYEETLTIINVVNDQLLKDGQIVTKPNPQEIIDILCNHHLLVKSIYPVNTIHFEHQQFQEYYASSELMNKIAFLSKSEDKFTIQCFQRDIINIPVWEEPLMLLAEELNRMINEKCNLIYYNIDAIVAGQNLIKWTMPVDPLFAAKLVGILGKAVWEKVKGEFEPLLRKWYQCENEDYRECALAAIYATGSDDFSDIIWPLIENTDQQVRLISYRAGRTFKLSCLGSDWKEMICKWEEDRREELIGELYFTNQTNIIEILEDYARNDPSPKVRASAIDAMDWCGRRDKMWQILRESNPDTFKVVIRNEHISLRNVPKDLLPRFTIAYQQLLSETDEPSKRLGILLDISDLSKQEYVDLLKSDVEKYPIQKQSDFRFSRLRDAVAKIASYDPDWASEWVVRKQAESKLCDEHWSVFIKKVPSEIIEQVIQELLKPDCQDTRADDLKYLISKGSTVLHAHALIQKYIEIHCQIKGRYVKDKSEMRHRLINSIRAIPWQVLAEAFLEDYSEPEINAAMEAILDLVKISIVENDKERPEIKKDVLDKFRTLLRGYSEKVLAINDYSGGLKADMSCALAVFGETNDAEIILQLIHADIVRIQKGIEALKREGRHSSLAQGATAGWGNKHIDALCRIDPENADKYLLKLLIEPEYEEYTGYGLVELLKRNIPKEGGISWGYKPLKVGTTLWQRDYVDVTKSRQYSSAIEKRIRNHIAESKRQGEPGWVGRLIISLASIGDPSAVPLILEAMQFPFKGWGSWRLDVLEILIKNGVILKTEIVEPIIEKRIAELVQYGNCDNNTKFMLTHCLCVLACTSDKPRAIAIIKEIINKYRLEYDIRAVIQTLGYTGSPEAANYLIELAENPKVCAYLGRELIQALANLDLPESKKAILSIIDPAIQKPKLIFSNKHYKMEVAATAIANWCKNDSQLKKRVFALCDEKLTKQQREMLAEIINNLDTTEAIFAGLNIMEDQSDNPIPFSLKQAIEKSVTSHIPLENNPNTYNIRPCENVIIRKKLFDMIYDDHTRCKSAFSLLGFVSKLRLEHGNPTMEPRHPNIESRYPWPPILE